MAALSGLTPALSRRLQQQLLAHLPPAAARSLRRTLSLHAAPASTSRHKTTRSHSASKSDDPHNIDLLDELMAGEDKLSRELSPKFEKSPDQNISNTDGEIHDTNGLKGVQRRYLRGHSAQSIDGNTSTENTPDKCSNVTGNSSEITTKNNSEDLINKNEKEENIERGVSMDLTTSQVSQFCTLPRLKRNTTISRDSTPSSSVTDSTGYDFSSKLSLGKEQNQTRGSSIRNTSDRPLLSKYLIPERHLSLDESYSSDSGSILSEPSYIAAYGTSSLGNSSNLGFRRHSLRLAGDQPRKRISRFLRSDFFDTPPDENLYAKHKKEKELETQKILKEIREKKIRSLESPKSPLDGSETPVLYKEESAYLRKCLSPVNNLISKERSRSSTPFFPILDNIKETNLDTSLTIIDPKKNTDEKKDHKNEFTQEKHQNKESKMARPKSYPIKKIDSFDEANKTASSDKNEVKDQESEERKLPKESKLTRPKSYPASTSLSEKINTIRNGKRDELQNSSTLKEDKCTNDCKNDLEVSFNIILPKRKSNSVSKSELPRNKDLSEQKTEIKTEVAPTLILKKYKVLNEENNTIDENNSYKNNGNVVENAKKNISSTENSSNKTDIKKSDVESNNKKIIKKKIIKKVSSKSKSDLNSQEATDSNNSSDKKKVVKKVKEKTVDDNSKSITTMKKKSVLQSISHKLEKFASTKSNSPEKSSQNSSSTRDSKKECSKLNRMQREQSVPVNTNPPTESNLIKRAVTLTDVAALESQNLNQNKTTVSKVLGLFKKFDPKEKTVKPLTDNSLGDNINLIKKNDNDAQTEIINPENEKEKPKRPTSLLLNGLGRKNKNSKAASDSASVTSLETDDLPVLKKDSEPKNVKNTLKLDFSRLPRVKKIVPTNPVIEPQIIDVSSGDKEIDNKYVSEKNGSISVGKSKLDLTDEHSRSRSRSRSIYSNSDVKSEHSADIKVSDKISDSFIGNSVLRPVQHNNDSTSPEKDDLVDRIRRKSFYSRFNEKKQRRKSSLVGPGATEYDPVARLHSQPTETKLDVSPTSPSTYDLSPGFSIASDLSPSVDRYRSLLADLPTTRSSSRYEGLNDKIDTYRSLDRNDFKKISSGKSYLDYDHSGSFGTHRYSRTKSLLENSDALDDHGISHLRDPIKYSRTNSLFTPGNYATYRPKRTRNSAIMLKESEKEPSPENILDKIRNRKISISVTRKQDPEDSLSRSNVPSKSEGDCAECSEKTD